MEIQRIKFKEKVKKMFNLNNGICYFKIRDKYYFLGTTKYNSIEMLRKFVNYKNKTPKLFYNIIHKHYLMECSKVEQTEIKKKPFYAKMRIQRAKDKIIKLKQGIEQEKENLIKLLDKGKLKDNTNVTL